MTLAKRCQLVELIVSDVDGVLTDGGIVYTNAGDEIKRFHIRDGQGIRLWHRAGGKFGIVTARNSHIVNVRAAELGVEFVRQGTEHKLQAFREILATLQLKPEQACYIGDDLQDLGAVRLAGLGVAVADAADELRQSADYVTTLGGGQGAVRETIELILKSQRRWEDLLQLFDG